MIIDKSLMFSDGQEVTATAASTVTVDVGAGDLGASPMELVVQNSKDAVGAGSLVVSLETADTADAATFVTLVASRSLLAADLKAGMSVLPIQVPHGAKRFLRLKYTVTSTLTATLSAFMVYDRNANPGV